uniref:Uncharacterized protein n=1 Tax=Rhizophora mucronata TaxID=61149 RepID=A0A2P2NN74_RHIMU
MDDSQPPMVPVTSLAGPLMFGKDSNRKSGHGLGLFSTLHEKIQIIY